MKTFCVLYSNGLSGTWLTWFINQHQGFPDRLELDYEYSDPQHPDRITDYTTQPKWWYNEQSWEDFMAYCERQDDPNDRNGPGVRIGFDRLAFKVQPYHEFFGPDMDWPKIVEHATHVINTTDCDIIVPIADKVFAEPLYNRLVAIRPGIKVNRDLTQWYFKDLYDYLENDMKRNVLRIDIGKIFTKDEQEYNKLIEYINAPALANWQHLVDNCVETVYSNYK